jgi:hypothetical protein
MACLIPTPPQPVASVTGLGFAPEKIGYDLATISRGDYLTQTTANDGTMSLVRDALKLHAGQVLVVIYPHSQVDVAREIERVAETVGTNVTLREYRASEFSKGYPNRLSPNAFRKSIPQPAAIVLLSEMGEATMPGRFSLLNGLQEQAVGWRIASMPGVDVESLRRCAYDFVALRTACLGLFELMARARSATLSTISPEGSPDSLVIPFADDLPLLSTGEIAPGCWGNFPSGETFLLPKPFAGHGRVTIRGSIPGHALGPGQWVRFSVARGRVAYDSVTAVSSALKERFLACFFGSDGGLRRANGNALCEFGIGVNHNIRELSGRALFDEKVEGAVHLAFGRNDHLRGPLRSSLRHSVVSIDGTVALGDHVAVAGGKLRVPDKTRTLDTFVQPAVVAGRLFRGHRISHAFDRARTGTSEESVFKVVYRTRREELAFIVARGQAAELAEAIMQALPTVKSKAILASQVHRGLGGSRSPLISRTIAGLIAYGLVENET